MDKIRKAHNKRGVQPLIIVGILMTLLVVIAVVRYLQPSIQHIEVTRFYDNAQAAYSIIHDDLCTESGEGILTLADTIAYNRGVRFATGAIVTHCVDGGDTLWDRIQTLVDHGHEIASHSWDHGAAIDLGWQPQSWNHDTDVVLSKKVLEDNLAGAEVTWFIFPYDAYNVEKLNELVSAGYLGARAGDSMHIDRAVNGRLKDFDPLRSNFDIYMSQEEQAAINASADAYTVSIYNNEGHNVALQHIDAAISVGGWSLQEMHTIAPPTDSIWGSITEKEYRRVLDYAVDKRSEGKLWIETPTKVAKYIVTRNGLGAPLLEGSSVYFPNKQLRVGYTTKVTLAIHTKHAPKRVFATIDGKSVEAVKAEENLFLIQYAPGSSVELSLK